METDLRRTTGVRINFPMLFFIKVNLVYKFQVQIRCLELYYEVRCALAN